MLVLDVFNDWIPFPFIVNLVAEAWRVDNSQIELDVVLLYACEAYTVSAVVVVNVAHGCRGSARARARVCPSIQPWSPLQLTVLDDFDLCRLPEGFLSLYSAL